MRCPNADAQGHIKGKSDLWTTLADKKTEETWITLPREQTFEGGKFHYLQHAPVYSDRLNIDDFLAVATIDGESYAIPRGSILTQFFRLGELEANLSDNPYYLLPYKYVWFRDNGIVGETAGGAPVPEDRAAGMETRQNQSAGRRK